VADVMPEFGHLPYVMGEGNKKLSKRDPESNLFLHRERGFTPEGLLNYLALLGWSISPDHDIFTVTELVEAFDVHDVLPNPARFDLKKAEAINATHVRLLAPEDFRDRLVPYLHAGGLVPADSFADLSPRNQEILTAAAPLVQERMVLLGESVGMLGFLFTADDALTVEDDARAALRDDAKDILAAAITALDVLQDGEFVTAAIEERLRDAIVEGMGVKPRFAFTPLRVALTGRRVSPPLFESMELLGKGSTLERLVRLRDAL